MKVIQTTYIGEYGDNGISVEIRRDNGEGETVSFIEGEPEDMSLSRDLIDAYSLVNLVKMAYEAGKEKETINFEYLKKE